MTDSDIQKSRRNIEYTTTSAQQTFALGKDLAKLFCGGDVVALIGDLGAGKTHLVKGIAAGLGVPDEQLVTSPTFVLVNEYQTADGRLEVYHLDAYRLKSVQEFEALGVADYCRPDAIVIVEWADKVWQAIEPLDPIVVRMTHCGQDRRRINISFSSDRFVGGDHK